MTPTRPFTILEHGLTAHLHLLDLQLVHLAQQREDLPLLVRADPARQLLKEESSLTQCVQSGASTQS